MPFVLKLPRDPFLRRLFFRIVDLSSVVTFWRSSTSSITHHTRIYPKIFVTTNVTITNIQRDAIHSIYLRDFIPFGLEARFQELGTLVNW